MREHGISPPPKPDLGIEELQQIKLPLFGGFLKDLDKWLRRLVDAFPKVQTTEVTLNPGSVAANTTAEQTFAVIGLRVQDIVTINKPTATAGFGIVGVRCSATDTLAITFCNVTAAPIDAGAEVYKIVAIRI